VIEQNKNTVGNEQSQCYIDEYHEVNKSNQTILTGHEVEAALKIRENLFGLTNGITNFG